MATPVSRRYPVLKLRVLGEGGTPVVLGNPPERINWTRLGGLVAVRISNYTHLVTSFVCWCWEHSFLLTFIVCDDNFLVHFYVESFHKKLHLIFSSKLNPSTLIYPIRALEVSLHKVVPLLAIVSRFDPLALYLGLSESAIMEVHAIPGGLVVKLYHIHSSLKYVRASWTCWYTQIHINNVTIAILNIGKVCTTTVST